MESLQGLTGHLGCVILLQDCVKLFFLEILTKFAKFCLLELSHDLKSRRFLSVLPQKVGQAVS